MDIYQTKYYRINTVKHGRREWPLWDHHRLCPTARYVGGTSRYLCECRNPAKCLGVLAAAEQYEEKSSVQGL